MGASDSVRLAGLSNPTPCQDRADPNRRTNRYSVVPNVFRLVLVMHEYPLVRCLQTGTHIEPKDLTDPALCSFGAGTAGPAFFSLGVRDATVIIIVTNLV